MLKISTMAQIYCSIKSIVTEIKEGSKGNHAEKHNKLKIKKSPKNGSNIHKNKESITY